MLMYTHGHSPCKHLRDTKLENLDSNKSKFGRHVPDGANPLQNWSNSTN